MNTPIDPREGNRRQKALQARLAALTGKRNKAIVGRTGQARGQVRSVGAIGGARGPRMIGNGAARPGALDFLQAFGFGLGAQGQGHGPAMQPIFGFSGPRRVSNPLPSQSLEGAQIAGIPVALNTPPPEGTARPSVDNPSDPGYLAPNPSNPTPGAIITEPSGRGAGHTSTAGALASQESNLIPLGGGVYLNPKTGVIHGGGAGGGPMRVL